MNRNHLIALASAALLVFSSAATAAPPNSSITGKDASAATVTMGAVSDGTLKSASHSLVDSTGAVLNPATSDNQINVQANAGSSSSKAIGVQGVSGGVAVPISGSVSVTGTLPGYASTPAFTISGTLPAFAATPTFNLGTLNGVALDTSVNGLLLSQGSTTSGQKGPLIQCAVTTAAPTYTTAQTSPASCDTAGNLRVSVGASALPTGGATAANQATANTSLAAISNAVQPYTPDSYTLQITAPTGTAVRSTVLGTGTTVAAYNSGLVPEFIAVGGSSVTATTGSWLIPPGNICYFNYAGGSAYVSGITSSGTGQLTLSSGSGGAQGCTTYTDVTTPSNVTALATATGGATPLTTAALSTTVTAIKASAGSLYMLRCYNPNSAAAYVQVFNVASGSVTLGTTTPIQSYGIAATSAGGFALSPVGIAFPTAISYAATTTATGSTANSTALTCSVAYN